MRQIGHYTFLVVAIIVFYLVMYDMLQPVPTPPDKLTVIALQGIAAGIISIALKEGKRGD